MDHTFELQVFKAIPCAAADLSPCHPSSGNCCSPEELQISFDLDDIKPDVKPDLGCTWKYICPPELVEEDDCDVPDEDTEITDPAPSVFIFSTRDVARKKQDIDDKLTTLFEEVACRNHDLDPCSVVLKKLDRETLSLYNIFLEEEDGSAFDSAAGRHTTPVAEIANTPSSSCQQEGPLSDHGFECPILADAEEEEEEDPQESPVGGPRLISKSPCIESTAGNEQPSLIEPEITSNLTPNGHLDSCLAGAEEQPADEGSPIRTDGSDPYLVKDASVFLARYRIPKKVLEAAPHPVGPDKRPVEPSPGPVKAGSVFKKKLKKRPGTPKKNSGWYPPAGTINWSNDNIPGSSRSISSGSSALFQEVPDDRPSSQPGSSSAWSSEHCSTLLNSGVHDGPAFFPSSKAQCDPTHSYAMMNPSRHMPQVSAANQVPVPLTGPEVPIRQFNGDAMPRSALGSIGPLLEPPVAPSGGVMDHAAGYGPFHPQGTSHANSLNLMRPRMPMNAHQPAMAARFMFGCGQLPSGVPPGMAAAQLASAGFSFPVGYQMPLHSFTHQQASYFKEQLGSSSVSPERSAKSSASHELPEEHQSTLPEKCEIRSCDPRLPQSTQLPAGRRRSRSNTPGCDRTGSPLRRRSRSSSRHRGYWLPAGKRERSRSRTRYSRLGDGEYRRRSHDQGRFQERSVSRPSKRRRKEADDLDTRNNGSRQRPRARQRSQPRDHRNKHSPRNAHHHWSNRCSWYEGRGSVSLPEAGSEPDNTNAEAGGEEAEDVDVMVLHASIVSQPQPGANALMVKAAVSNSLEGSNKLKKQAGPKMLNLSEFYAWLDNKVPNVPGASQQ